MNLMQPNDHNQCLLQQEVKSFFQDQSIYEVEQHLYDMLQNSIFALNPEDAKDKLHTYRQVVHFMYRLTQLV